MRPNFRNMFMTAIVLLCVSSLLFAGGGREAATDEPYEILWYQIGNPDPQQDVVFEAVNEWLVPRIGARVRRVMIGWGDYPQRMTAAISSGEPFDIAFSASWMNYNTWASIGGLAPLDDLLVEHAPETLEMLPTPFIEGNRIDGRLYGLAANKELAHQWAFILNERMVREHGFEVPEIATYELMDEWFSIIAANEPGVTPFVSRGTLMMNPWINSAFDFDDNHTVYRDDPNFEVVDIWATPEMEEHLRWMRRWYLAGYFPADIATITEDPTTQGVQDNFARITSHTPYAELAQSRNSGYPVIHLPIHEPIISTRDVGGSMQVISATSERPDLAMQFLNLLNTDEYLRNLVQFGIEGVHYEVVGPGVISREGMTPYNPIDPWAVANMLITYRFPDVPEDIWDEYERFNESAYVSRTLGFNFDPTPVQTEWAAVQNVNAEYVVALQTGSVDIDRFLPEYLQRKRQAGGDIIRAEIQRQLDEWRGAGTASR